MAEIWLHIGTQKTGSTSVQHFGRNHASFLAEQGVSFIGLGKRSSLNRLPKAMRQRKPDAVRQLGAWAEAGIAAATARHVVLSSEMFVSNGVDLDLLKEVVPSLTRMPLNIVIYLRRQDKWHESHYRQRVKTGRYGGSFVSFFEKTRDAYGDYDRILTAWQAAFPDATFHVRRFEKNRLKDGDVVSDFMSLLGVLDLPDQEGAAQSNVSPGVELLTVLKLMKKTGAFDVGKMRQAIQSRCDVSGSRARLMPNDYAREIVRYYEDSNEAVRRAFFPQDAQLFDLGDIQGEGHVAEGFSDEQQALIRAMLDAIAESQSKAA